MTEPTGTGQYSYVARRTRGFVAVAREQGLGKEVAARVADHLADSMDACATRLAASGRLVDGAIRLEASVDAGGSVAVGHLTIAPGDAVAANALLCVVAPFKMMTFPVAADDAGARALALDATWGPGP